MHFRYSDDTIGLSKQVAYGGKVYPSTYLDRRKDRETEAEWIARIAAIGVVPVRYVYPDLDRTIYDLGDSSEAMQDGWLVISYPSPVAKTFTAEEVETRRIVKQSEIRDAADALLKTVGAEYGDIERATWDQQYSEALAVQAAAEADAPLLSAIAAARGMDVATLATRIIANRAAWVAISGHVVGQRLALQDRLDAATTVAEIEAIEVAYTLPGASS